MLFSVFVLLVGTTTAKKDDRLSINSQICFHNPVQYGLQLPLQFEVLGEVISL